MDGATLTYDNDYFDAIIDNVCIYANTIENIRSMYTECYRVLKPSGKLITVAFSTETTGYGSGIEIEKNTYKDISHGRLEGRGTTHFFEEEELKHILSNTGFKNIQIDYINYTDCGDLISMFVTTCEK